LLLKEQEKFVKQISSQVNPEGLKGSETRAYDPKRVMKLYKCLEKVEQYLNQLPY
jgi:hypothetical protein